MQKVSLVFKSKHKHDFIHHRILSVVVHAEYCLCLDNENGASFYHRASYILHSLLLDFIDGNSIFLSEQTKILTKRKFYHQLITKGGGTEKMVLKYC